MRSGNQIYGIVVDELLRDIGAKEISGTSWGDAPSFDVWNKWIGRWRLLWFEEGR